MQACGACLRFIATDTAFLASTAPKVDLEKTDFKKMRVKQLKGLLAEHGVACDGCVEKSDYIKKVKKSLGKQEKKEL